MIDLRCDLAVLGSGFGGSLTALLAQQLGLRVVLVDRGCHPRFAIGESSTPIANLVWHELTQKYSLESLTPLSKYGTWRAQFPALRCGLKRGFSYFDHRAGEPFRGRPDHNNELLVAASDRDETGDTHWLRADVDGWLVTDARRRGIDVLERAELTAFNSNGTGWRIQGQCNDQRLQIDTRFVVDATGPAAVMPRALKCTDITNQLRTRSAGYYTHFKEVASWSQKIASDGASISDHPFDCDAAAQHHLVGDGWMWMLRFCDGTTSVGVMADGRSAVDAHEPAVAWDSLLKQYPSLESIFKGASLAAVPGRWICTPRLQRMWKDFVGPNWAALPNTAGFIDPLHSTGIAQTLCGVERLIAAIEEAWGTDKLHDRLRDYQAVVSKEFFLIDQIVSACYRVRHSFPLFSACCMVYFAAATTYERQRQDGERPGAFLCADDEGWARIVAAVVDSLPDRPSPDSDHHHLIARVKDLVAPYNHVGLFSPDVANMYRYTAADIR